MEQTRRKVTIGGELQGFAACPSPPTSALFWTTCNLMVLQDGFNAHANGTATDPMERQQCILADLTIRKFSPDIQPNFSFFKLMSITPQLNLVMQWKTGLKYCMISLNWRNGLKSIQ